MIAKMKFLKIQAPLNRLDYVIDNYVAKYDIQVENAVAELNNLKNMVVHNEANPYRELLGRVNELYDRIKADDSSMDVAAACMADVCEAMDFVKSFLTRDEEYTNRIKKAEMEYTQEKEVYENIIPFANIHYDFHKILDFKFIKYRFGRIPKEYYKRLCDFVNEDDMCSVFCECSSDKRYVWGFYCAPESQIANVDAIYSSMYFDTCDLKGKYDGMLDEAENKLGEAVSKLKKVYDDIVNERDAFYKDNLEKLLEARNLLEDANRNFDIRKQMAYIRSGDEEYFIMCGWMPDEDACRIEKEIEKDKDIITLFEDDHKGPFGGAPVKLKNPKILKPFEMLIRMYGMPDYHEFDPTWFVAISYTIIFGMMFGDVGQGICLLIGGFLLYKLKGMNLAAIISVAGLFSTIFGFLFGSVFGYEELIEPLWIKPTEAMTDLPFIGKLNTIFACAITLGMILILLMMVFNVINAIKAGELKEAIFDHNGICGFIFYGSVVACVMLFMTGHALPGTVVLVIMFVIPLILIALKEPIMAIVFKKTEAMPKQAGIFAVQAFFEMFEVLLSYFSNTLSFVRIGGFAVSHASMMGVVMMLAGAENGGMGNLIVVILGNLFVCGLEGLIVGIQVMRLEYYEMFSRFYRGGGREFKPYRES